MQSVFPVLILLALSISTTNLMALGLKPSPQLEKAPPIEPVLPKNPSEAIANEHVRALEHFAEGRCGEGQSALLRLKVLAAEHKLPAHEFVAEQKKCAEYRMETIVIYMRLAYFTQDLSMVKKLAEEARRLAVADGVDVPDDILNMTKKMASGYNQLLYIKLKTAPKAPVSV